MPRDSLDRYYTPKWATERLLKYLYLDKSDVIFEPCAGKLDIAKVIYKAGYERIYLNDIDPATTTHSHVDAEDFIREFNPRKDFFDSVLSRNLNQPTPPAWVITNPPFSEATRILKTSHAVATKGIAFLLRLSWLEPCKDRAEFLEYHPPTKLIILPRISFTGDGKVDSVTCAWMVWDKFAQETEIAVEVKR